MYSIYRNCINHLWPDGPWLMVQAERDALMNWTQYCADIVAVAVKSESSSPAHTPPDSR